MKVLHFGKFYPPHRGGMESFLATLCEGLVKRGVDCEVLVAAEGIRAAEEIHDEVVIRRMASVATVSSLPICLEAIWILGRIRANIINLHYPNPLADLSYLIAQPKGLLIVTYHSDIIGKQWLSRLHAPLLHRVLDRADAVVATSPQYVASSPVLEKYAHKINIIPLGLAAPDYDDINRHFSTPAGKTGSAPQFFFIGRLVSYKGVSVLLDALRYAPGNLWIAGTGPLEESLRTQVKENNLQARVEFLGDISEKEKFSRLAACDALILPSITRAEAFGIVLLEAMAMGRPVVVSDLPTGVQLLVQHGLNGLRFLPGNAPALAAALKRLLEDPEAARQMGEAGRKIFLEHYTAEKMVDRYLELYYRLQHQAG